MPKNVSKKFVNVLKLLPALTNKILFWKGTEDCLQLNYSLVSKFEFVYKLLHQSNTQSLHAIMKSIPKYVSIFQHYALNGSRKE